MLMTRGGCRPFPVRIPLLALFHQNFIVFGSVLVYSAYLKSRSLLHAGLKNPSQRHIQCLLACLCNFGGQLLDKGDELVRIELL